MEEAVMLHTRMVRSMHTGIDTVQSTEKALHQYNGTLARANGARVRDPSEFEPALNCPAVAGRCARFAVEAVTVSSSSLIMYRALLLSCSACLLLVTGCELCLYVLFVNLTLPAKLTFATLSAG